jgi:long-chain acyl-CoA synthetase
LNEIDDVKDSCVLGLESDTGIVRIHAILLLNNNSLNPENILEQVNKKLATYQRISEYTVWPDTDFPRSATRKIKREEILGILKDIMSKKGEVKLNIHSSPLIKLLSRITGIDTKNINNQTKILSNLQLDSLMKVELILTIEQDFGVLLDENLLTEEITIQDLQNIIDKKEFVKKVEKIKKWPRCFLASIIRTIGQFKIILLSRIFFRLKIKGLENIKNIKAPVIFMPNHISYADPLVLLMALPYQIRKTLCFAAAKDFLYKDFKYISWLADLFFNSFPLPRGNGDSIKSGLESVGQLIDENYSVVVFPEGKVSSTGNFLSLKKGAGLMAIEMCVPVIPVKIVGTNNIVPYEKLFPRKIGEVIVEFGEPISFKKSTSYELATKTIEEAMKKL